MRVDDTKGRGLRAQVQKNAGERRMFEHIGEVAGMKGVPIVHPPSLRADMLCASGLLRRRRRNPGPLAASGSH